MAHNNLLCNTITEKPMTKPKIYEPAQGYSYQVLFRGDGSREWDHCDYAEDSFDKDYLLQEYRLAGGGEYKAIALPEKYHPDPKAWSDAKIRHYAERLNLSREGVIQKFNLI